MWLHTHISARCVWAGSESFVVHISKCQRGCIIPSWNSKEMIPLHCNSATLFHSAGYFVLCFFLSQLAAVLHICFNWTWSLSLFPIQQIISNILREFNEMKNHNHIVYAVYFFLTLSSVFVGVVVVIATLPSKQFEIHPPTWISQRERFSNWLSSNFVRCCHRRL